jgi:hypothetical protein
MIRHGSPPKVGDVFLGPPINESRSRGKYTVAAVVDLGFLESNPSFYQVVFRFWAQHKKRWAWEVVSADAIDVGLYRPKKGRRKEKHS